jgi:hypothetical protein
MTEPSPTLNPSKAKEHVYWRTCFRVPDRRPPWQWGAEKMKLKGSPFGKRFMPELTPWLKEPLEAIADNKNQEITCMCCVQGGKTTVLTVTAAWATAFQPDAMMITCQTDDDAKFLAKERIRPALESIAEIRAKLPHDKSKNSTLSISMSDMFIEIQGANEGNLQSKPVRWVLNDEVYLWDAGFLQQARNRATRFWNRRILNVSTAGDKGSDLDNAFNDGDMREFHLLCPACNELFWPKWECVKWPKQDDWNWTMLKGSAYLECPKCKAQHRHTLETHRKMVGGGRYVATNKNAAPGKLSFRWNALVLSPAEVSWGDLAVEWVKAEIEFNKGNDHLRKEFITKRLAESYDPNKFFEETKLPTVKSEDWPDEKFRFLTVDVQELEFWVVVRAWSTYGASRLKYAGRVLSYEDIEKLAADYNVPSQCVFIDSSYDTRKVYYECAKRNIVAKNPYSKQPDWYGWRALNGEAEARKGFTKKKGKYTISLPYSAEPRYIDPLNGTAKAGSAGYCKLTFWSNIEIKDILKRLRDGKGAEWVAYEGVPKDWEEQMFSERRIRVYDKFNKETYKWDRIGKRPNHLWDCECMQIVAACIAGIIGGETEAEAIKDNTPAVIDS